jgi:hypothetical protein
VRAFFIYRQSLGEVPLFLLKLAVIWVNRENACNRIQRVATTEIPTPAPIDTSQPTATSTTDPEFATLWAAMGSLAPLTNIS